MSYTIGACGYNATGSSAITDLLKEFEENYVFDKCEFIIPYDPDGLLDLRHHLTEGSIKHTSSGVALRRFMDACSGYPFRQIAGYTSGDLERLASDFLDKIVQCRWVGQGADVVYYDWARRLFLRGIRKLNLGFAYRAFDGLMDRGTAVFPYKEAMYSCYPEDFDLAAKAFVDQVLERLGKTPGKNIVLDQPFPGNNPQAVFPFFENPKAIVVDRDPRDYFLLCREYYSHTIGWRVVPTNSVENFVSYYRGMRESAFGGGDNPDILRIRLEELIYEYDLTLKRIVDFCHLEDHSSPMRYFDPGLSVNNTQMFKHYRGYEKEISYIEKHLSEYLYDFDHHGFVKLDRAKMFTEQSPLNSRR